MKTKKRFNVKSNRENDMKVEREVAAFLNEQLYPDNEIFKEIIRTDGKKEQLDGSDLIITTSDGKLNRVVVDEKCAHTWANKPLNSFVLELSHINENGKEVDGWFIKPDSKTEYYLFMWVPKADIPFLGYDYRGEKKWDTNLVDRNNIRELEWALVSKKKLVNFLEARGWTTEKLREKNAEIREREGVSEKGYKNGVGFVYISSLAEQPVNVKLEKKTYMDLSDYNGKIVC